MQRHPRLKRHISVIPHDSDRVELRAGGWNVVSMELNDEKRSGKLFSLLCALDGTRPAADIARAEGVARSEVEALLDHLIQLDVIDIGPSSALDYYLETAAAPLVRAHSESPALRDLVILGHPDTARALGSLIGEACPEATITVADPDDPEFDAVYGRDTRWLHDGLELERKSQAMAHLQGKLVVHVDKALQPTRLGVLNRLAIQVGFDWLQGCIDGPQLLIGPFFEPGHTPCFECLETRVLMNMRDGQVYAAYKTKLADGEARLAADPSVPILNHLAVSHLAMETLNVLLTGTTYTRGKLLTIYLPTMEFAYHDLLRVPGCAACSPPAESGESELYFDMRTLVEA